VVVVLCLSKTYRSQHSSILTLLSSCQNCISVHSTDIEGSLTRNSLTMDGARKRKATATPSTSDGSAQKKLRLLVRLSFLGLIFCFWIDLPGFRRGRAGSVGVLVRFGHMLKKRKSSRDEEVSIYNLV